MPSTSTTATEIPLLSPAEKRVAAVLVTGASNTQIARELFFAKSTVTHHITSINKKCNTVGRTSRPVCAHALLASGQVSPPSRAPVLKPELTASEQQLLLARAQHSEIHDIACAAGVNEAKVGPLIKALVVKSRAKNATHLIGIAHKWGWLSGPSENATDGA
ncbi:LuxR C-terminal-related transcriptional regulator [Streptomyces sp. NPDC020707]|uniref:LuxR C-terminal-related transcriptional regulator n=1 Tax=Streptomyces sp. NPDC020707 TaxID=3365084 RepID=UPI00378A9A73